MTALEKDEDQKEEQQATQEEDKPGEPTTHQLIEVLTTITRLGEQLQEYDTRPHAQNHICPVIDKLLKAQTVNALANINIGDDDGITDDDIEVLGDLLVEELPQDLEGFDVEVRGGSSNQPSLPRNPSTSPN
ncbi:hypothetical protein Hamer_G005011 [Homarus americanus]|uniref:Uncharacterized protein n=1 Tax=Homarus americanus TaxID=6706 RepID=A0A8J5JV42_HOMAM|nr:hypothetical protein Hamer_G005011 [Homarus americanus]